MFGTLCFNPSTHAGCDRIEFDASQYKDGFNQRTHAGCDLILEF